MFYQCVCINNHYTEITELRDTCVDCFCELKFIAKIDNNIMLNINPQDVNRNFKYLNYLNNNKDLLIEPNQLKNIPLEKIVELFKYFNYKKDNILKIEWRQAKDMDNEYIPYVVATWGQKTYLTSGEFWDTIFLDEYGMQYTETELNDIKNIYECYQHSYDYDIKSMVIELYTNIWNRKYKIITES